MEISIEYSYREKFLAIQVAPHKSLLKFLYLQNDQAGFGDLWDNFFSHGKFSEDLSASEDLIILTVPLRFI